MSLADLVRNLGHGSFMLADGTSPSAVTLPVAYDDGALSVSNLGSGGLARAVQAYQRRGVWVADAYGEAVFPVITFTAWLTGEAASGDGSVQAFLSRFEPYEDNISVQGDGRVYGVNLRFDVEGSDEGADDWSTTFLNCVPTVGGFNEDWGGDKFSFSLEVHGIGGVLATGSFPLTYLRS